MNFLHYLGIIIYISPSIIYTTQGSDVNITATYYFGNKYISEIAWFFDDVQIDISENPYYFTVRTEDTAILGVRDIDQSKLGTYMVALTHWNDTVRLAYRGMYLVVIYSYTGI